MPMLNLRGAERVDPASMGTLVGAKPPAAGEDFTLRASLQCYYKFENGADLGEDYKGNIALTNVNGVTQSATIPSGTYAGPTAIKSADFERASSQYLSATHDASILIDDITALTVVAWFNPESWAASSCIYLKSGFLSDGHGIYIVSTGTNPRGLFSGNDASRTQTFSAGTWYFICFTYSQTSDLMKVYTGTESVQVTELGTSTSLIDATASTTYGFRIGCASWAVAYLFDGLICEPAWFTEELSLAELQELQQYGMDGSG